MKVYKGFADVRQSEMKGSVLRFYEANNQKRNSFLCSKKKKDKCTNEII